MSDPAIVEEKPVLTVYGIKNCDTMKKAFAWLDERGIPYRFHDYKKAGVPDGLLEGWAERLGWEALVKKTGTTWRKLPEEIRQKLDRDRALALLREQTSLIRRPILMDGELLLAGFEPEAWERVLEKD